MHTVKCKLILFIVQSVSVNKDDNEADDDDGVLIVEHAPESKRRSKRYWS